MKTMRMIALGCALAIVGGLTAVAATIFDDQFTYGTREDAGYYISQTSTGATASVSGGVLSWTDASTGTAPSVVWKNFTSYDLSAAADGTYEPSHNYIDICLMRAILPA